MGSVSFFKSKQGKKLRRKYITQDKEYSDVLDRLYTIEILGVDKDKEEAKVVLKKSDTLTAGKGTTENKLISEDIISVSGEESGVIIEEYITNKDKDFFKKYPNATQVYYKI